MQFFYEILIGSVLGSISFLFFFKEDLFRLFKIVLSRKNEAEYINKITFIQSLFRKSIQNNTIHNTKKRYRLAKELLKTEEEYIKRLKILNKVFITPLQTSKRLYREYGIKENEFKTIFNPSALSAITGFHSGVFLVHLEQGIAHQNWSIYSGIGDIFLKSNLAKFLGIYKQYINHYDLALSTMIKCQSQNQQFSQFITKANESPETEGHTVQSLLIVVIQRVPRYVMILKEMLKYTPTSHHDYLKITESLLKVQTAAREINESKRLMEEKNKVIQIFNLFTPRMTNLITPSRRLVKEGVLTQIVQGKGTEYNFYLFNDILMKGNPPKVIERRNITSLIKIIPHLMTSSSVISHCFSVKLDNDYYTLKAKDEEERKEWVKAFNRVNDDNMEISFAGKRINGTRAVRSLSMKRPVTANYSTTTTNGVNSNGLNSTAAGLKTDPVRRRPVKHVRLKSL